jgi:hypothetical protein
MLRSPKRKLREITLFDPRNAFPRLAPFDVARFCV